MGLVLLNLLESLRIIRRISTTTSYVSKRYEVFQKRKKNTIRQTVARDRERKRRESKLGVELERPWCHDAMSSHFYLTSQQANEIAMLASGHNFHEVTGSTPFSN